MIAWMIDSVPLETRSRHEQGIPNYYNLCNRTCRRKTSITIFRKNKSNYNQYCSQLDLIYDHFIKKPKEILIS